jgi:hypothetical protein
MSLHAQALVVTADPSGCGERLVRELRATYETEWAAEAGHVTGAGATCELHSWPDGLRLDAFADTDAALRGIEDVVKRTIEHIGAPERLHVDWYRRPAS